MSNYMPNGWGQGFKGLVHRFHRFTRNVYTDYIEQSKAQRTKNIADRAESEAWIADRNNFKLLTDNCSLLSD